MLHAAIVPCRELHAALALLRVSILHVADCNNMLHCYLMHGVCFACCMVFVACGSNMMQCCMLHATWCRVCAVCCILSVLRVACCIVVCVHAACFILHALGCFYLHAAVGVSSPGRFQVKCLHGKRLVLCVACCRNATCLLLRVSCCVLHAACCISHATIAWRKSHVACCVWLLHVASFNWHATCSRSHVAYSGCMLHRRVACCPARSVRTVFARCNYCRILGSTSHIGIHVASCILRVSCCASHDVLGECSSGRADR